MLFVQTVDYFVLRIAAIHFPRRYEVCFLCNLQSNLTSNSESRLTYIITGSLRLQIRCMPAGRSLPFRL